VTGQDFFVTAMISKNSQKQRRGRVGRVRKGFYFPAFTKDGVESMPTSDPPEIATGDLAGPSLQLHVSGYDPASFPFLDSPACVAIGKAANVLENIGAMTAERSVTLLGSIISSLIGELMTPRQARCILEGVRRKCVVEMAGLRAMENVFSMQGMWTVTARGATYPVNRKLLTWSSPEKNHGIDILPFLELLEGYIRSGEDPQWCEDNNIKPAAMESVMGTRQGIMVELAKKGVPLYVANRKDPRWYESIRACILAGYGDQVAQKMHIPRGAKLGLPYHDPKIPGLVGSMASLLDSDGPLKTYSRDSAERKPVMFPPQKFVYEKLSSREIQGLLSNRFVGVTTLEHG
jgi:HrpA-like RNA helicase